MIINSVFIAGTVGLKVDPKFECQTLGLVNSNETGTMSFLDDVRFVNELIGNPNIIAVITTSQLARLIKGKTILYSEDPRYDFYSLYNHYAQTSYKKKPTTIHKTANIHPGAFISEFNVEIGENCIVEPNVTVLPDVMIGNNSIIRAGAVIGAVGFEHKRTRKGILSVFHSKRVIIKECVEVGSNSVIEKGLINADTIIESYSKIGSMVCIGHSTKIGSNCFVASKTVIGGSCHIGSNCWIGINVTLSNNINIADEAVVLLGAVVVENVSENCSVGGNFAYDKRLFIKDFKKKSIK